MQNPKYKKKDMTDLTTAIINLHEQEIAVRALAEIKAEDIKTAEEEVKGLLKAYSKIKLVLGGHNLPQEKVISLTNVLYKASR